MLWRPSVRPHAFPGLASLDILTECEPYWLGHFSVASWCNWLTRRPLKAESTGSIPVDATNPSKPFIISSKWHWQQRFLGTESGLLVRIDS
jgi:hypothetical protein